MGVPPGPRVGEVLNAVYERQLGSEITTVEAAIAAARELVPEGGPANQTRRRLM